jgi:cytochrome c oxidase cbb3-type subunit 1
MRRGARAGLAPALASELALHALGWLAAGCAVGLLLALLLAWPAGNALLAPLTYGRWASLHLDLLLYGWLALPLVGLLLRHYLPGVEGRGPGRIALAGWSGALGAGALALLGGVTSGKLFLEWRALAAVLFLGALALLWGALAFGFARDLGRGPRRPAGETAMRAALLLALATAPVAMALALDPRHYPPIDPTTGGPTGTDLLASTLAILPLFFALPTSLGLQRTPRAPRLSLLWALFAVHAALLPAFGFGDQPHSSPRQIAAIASVLLWPLPLARHLLGHVWPAGSRRWLAALGAWGTLLAGSALVTFLPGVLDRVKFSHALVGHAHLAMAGFSSALAALVLHALLADRGTASPLAAPRPFALWQAGAALQVLALVALGALEAGDPALLARADPRVALLFALRGVAGVAMLAAALGWLSAAWRECAAGTGPERWPAPVEDGA